MRRLRRNERGTAVVEFAIVAVPLFLIVFGIIDFGRALQYYNDMTQLAGQGARAAAVNRNPNGGAADSTFQDQLACDATAGELRKKVNVQIIPPTGKSVSQITAGDPVQVKTSFAFTFFPYLGKFINLSLSATQTERYESGSTPTFTGPDVTGC